MSDDRKIVTLRYPIQIGQRAVEQLAFRRGRFEDLKGLDIRLGDDTVPVPFEALIKIAGRMCGEIDAVIGKLEGEDMAEVAQIALGFYLSWTGQIGPTPSPSSP